MNAEILAVGTEILMGQITNTNAQYISSKLSSIGINVYFHSVVGDNPVRLTDVLKIALYRSDLVIMTGGLGPTQDDLTKETVASMFRRKLVLHDESLKKIKDFFCHIGRTMSDNNIKQAYLPENCIIVENNNGTAPGCIIENDNKIVVMLPGPPSEMKPMLDQTVIPYLMKKSNFKLVSKYLRVFGVGESALENKLIDLIEKQSNPTIAPYAKEGEVTLRVTARSENEDEALKLIDPIVEEIQNRLEGAVYSTCDKNLEEVVGEMLINKDITLSIAESCTGGLLSSRLTSISGISKVFNRSVISYSNESKIENLGVKLDILNKYGAVSKETAIEMANGIRGVAKTDLGISITGIAGPGGGSEDKPVGLVYIALSDSLGTEYKELKLHGNRERIRNITCLYAFDMIRRKLLKDNN